MSNGSSAQGGGGLPGIHSFAQGAGGAQAQQRANTGPGGQARGAPSASPSVSTPAPASLSNPDPKRHPPAPTAAQIAQHEQAEKEKKAARERVREHQRMEREREREMQGKLPPGAQLHVAPQQQQQGQQGRNVMSVSSMLSGGPPRAGSGTPAAYSPTVANATPQPPVLPPPPSAAGQLQEGKAASPTVPLPGFVQGGVKPSTAPPGSTPSLASAGVGESGAKPSYPPLPSAFARENPYSPSPPTSVSASPASAAQGGAPSPAAGLAPGQPHSTQAAQTIKNSFFPSLAAGPGRPAMPGAPGRTSSGASVGAAGGVAPAGQAGQQYPWQQAHLAGYPPSATAAAGAKQGEKPGHGRTASASTPATGQQRPAAPPAAQGQAKPAQAAAPRYSSLLSEGPFGARAAPQQASATASPATNGAQAQANGSAGTKRRRSDGAEQHAAHAHAHAHAAHQHAHSHAHQHQHAHAHSHAHSHAAHPTHAHVHQHHHHHASPASAAVPSAATVPPPATAGAAPLPALPSLTSRKSGWATSAVPPPAPVAAVRTPPPAATPPPPPPPPFTYTDLRKATVHPPLVEVENAAVDAFMASAFSAAAAEGERPFLGRFTYDPLTDPAKLLDGELLRQGVGGIVELVVPTSWLLGPAPPSSPSASGLAATRLSSSLPPTEAHPVALDFGPPSSYTGAPLPGCSETSLLRLPPHLTDLPSLRQRKVWGTDVYTDDSDVLAVLLHSGWVRVARRERRPRAGERGAGADALRRARVPGSLPPADGKEGEAEGGKGVPPALLVRMGVCPALVRYQGLERGGVRSRSWGNGHDGVSLRVEDVSALSALPPDPSLRQRRSSTASFAQQLSASRASLPPPSAYHSSLADEPYFDDGERAAKRYCFSLPSPAPSAGAEKEEEVVEVTDTFILDLRTGRGRFVGLEDEEEGARMEVEVGV
ncbi:hypothetical protein JCM10213v2_000858 [Rhodosporidiobolus nylandii]